MKYTNTKIIHKLFAQDDKDAVGNTMALSDEQKSFLSNLSPGRAIMFSQEWTKAIQLQVAEKVSSERKEVEPSEIRRAAKKFGADLVIAYIYANAYSEANDDRENTLRGVLDKIIADDQISMSVSAIGLVGSLATKAANFIEPVTTLPLGSILDPVLERVIIHFTIKAIEYLARKLGIIEEHDKAEEVGYRVEEAQEHEDWKRQEDFETFEDYYAYLKAQIPDDKIDRKKLAENRDRCAVLGMMELTDGLERRMDITLPEDL